MLPTGLSIIARFVLPRTIHRAVLLPVVAAVWAPLPAAPHPEASIIRRHDRPDSLYLELGRQYSTLAHLYLPAPTGAADGEGTVIAPRWVLTAAHVAAEVKPGHRITAGGEAHTVDSIVLHPDWNDGPHDIALLRLTQPVRGVRPAQLYRGSAELDQLIVVVGYGDMGTGLSGPTGNDGQIRGATNRVDEATDFWLKFLFDAPDSARSTPLEGISGPGDSGGPAFLDGVEDEILVGVGSGQSTRATGGNQGRYGVTEFYTRVSRYVDWIESVTGPLMPDDWPTASDSDRVAIGAAARAFSAAYVSDDTASLGQLYADSAVLLPPNREVRGRPAIQRYFTRGANQRRLSHMMRSERLTIFGDVAVDVGTWTAMNQRGEESPVTSLERYLLVWVRESDGQWRMLYDMWHRPAP